jgi:molybdenum-dependent DNA-binding transcriptional regulator ModE
MYQSIWLRIKQVKMGEEVQVRIHTSVAARLIQAVRKEKTIETAAKKKLGMPYAGMLKVRRAIDTNNPNFEHIYFSIPYDWSKM